MILDNILEEINKAEDIVILTHETPDGDAIGSSLALYGALKSMGKKADVIIPECPEIFNFLPWYEEIRKEGKEEKYSLAIALDCSDIKRLNGFAKYFETAKTKIVIDHHGSNTMFGDFNFVNPDSPAACQILVTVLEYMGIEINKGIGACIATGIITDTGGFRHSTIKPETFEFTAELLKKGVNISSIYRRVMQITSMRQFEIRRIALNRMEFLEDGKIAFTYITKKEQEELGIGVGDHEGIVEFGRDVEGVEVSIFLRELPDGGYKASFRSNEYVNVSDICLLFGGGGHPKAAGCNINLPLEQSKEKLVSETKKYLK
ncbi:MAG: bifunctional oligoribonuclease/PAP phosphatase NrnA [Clostridia bacterium]|nr:bifunctional oligoribonuclease/PAP phosphatase NrnA [Clostridia bacterium]